MFSLEIFLLQRYFSCVIVEQRIRIEYSLFTHYRISFERFFLLFWTMFFKRCLINVQIVSYIFTVYQVVLIKLVKLTIVSYYIRKKQSN